MSEALLVLIAASVVGLLIAEWRWFRRPGAGRAPAAHVLKPLASLGFVALAFAREPPETSARVLVVLGLGLSVFGDLFLLSRARAWFLAGIGAFLLAHLAYAAAFVEHGVVLRSVGFGAAFLAVPAALMLRTLWPRLSGFMRGAVPAYVLVISGMLALGIATRMPWLSGPAILFYLSDLFVARERFLHSAFSNRLFGLPLYYAAQVLFAWG